MEVGIVGLKGCGKTTLFRALTGMRVQGFSEKAYVGVANIPDTRLQVIARYITTRKIVPATVQLVDLPGVPSGGDAKKLNLLLEQIRQVDAICHVVRCFDDGSGAIDPKRDLALMESELILADLVVVEGALDKAHRTARTGDADGKARVAVLERAKAALEEGAALLAGKWSDAEWAIVRSYGVVTAKPVLYVANVGEDDPKGEGAAPRHVADHARAAGSESVALSAKLEAEIAELDESDRAEMLEPLGLTEPAIGPLARAAHAALGLRTFYTAGDKEVRAWTIREGALAPEAAGSIHTDLERGFIRAECYHVDDLVRYENEKAIRDAGKLRSEGKSYELRDGDVVHFLFNV